MQPKQQKTNLLTQTISQALSNCPQEQQQQVHQLLNKNNERGKIKYIKKVLESADPDSQMKILFNEIMGPVIVQEYLFGENQAKPTVLNIFKVLHVLPKTLTGFQEQLKTFQQVKRMIQIIQMLGIANKISNEQKSLIRNGGLIKKIYQFLGEQLQKGAQTVVKNQFRVKWLQHFVEVLRCVNYVVRFIGQQRQEYKQKDEQTYKNTQKCANCSPILTKQIITQVFLLLVYLNKSLPLPESPLQQIHFLHASTIVNNKDCLKDLLKLASELKDTQYKSQLTPILLKSFVEHFHLQKKDLQVQMDEQLKNNAFDSSVALFDVGRSVYSYLEDIIGIIIHKGGNWSLQGNFTRKFFIAKIALKYVPSTTILTLWPTCLEDCFLQSGNMTLPYVVDCAEALLTKIYTQMQKDYTSWMNVWIQPYKKALLSNSRAYTRGVTEFINPILLKINNSNSSLLREILAMPQNDAGAQLGIISLIKCYKEIGKIQSKHNVYVEQVQKVKDQAKIRAKNSKKQNAVVIVSNETVVNKQYQNQVVFIHLDDPSFEFGSEFLLDLLLSNDSMTAVQTLQFLITTKKPSQLLHPLQMDMILQFYKNCLKTSLPQYRKSYLNLTRKLLERFRKNYQTQIVNKKQQKQAKKQYKPTQYFEQFVNLLNQMINLSFINIYPDSIFQITNPALEILLLIVNLFGPTGCEIKKGIFIEPSNILKQKTAFFAVRNFENLVICMQSSYQSIRSMAHDIINNFTEFDERGVKTLLKIWDNSIQNTNKLSIKSYEFACRMLIFISNIKIKGQSLIKGIQNKYSIHELNVFQYFLTVFRSRYEIFKSQFIDQNNIYYKNLVHGILTCFSYILQQIASISSLKQKGLSQINTFLSQFFKQMTKILNFSVDISSANMTTVVLDTIANASQTDKKMTVDCRGHFLSDKVQKNQKKTVGSYLDSTALISSMQNQQQGIQNTLVVSFYLLTRQAGLVFQSIGILMTNGTIAKHIPRKQLIQLVNTYFYALINLKHMGSVDRISKGLSKMAKVIFDQEDTELIKIPEQLINKLLELLADGKFTSILRRSSGVPYAFSCLLKSQAIKRKVLIEKTIKSLIQLSKQSKQQTIQLRIHSLNILKKLFQDSDLKQDLDMYVSEAFITSIRGFTSQEWGVRNSSLMLFSVLANRTVGTKPTYNLLQFFNKCPQLLTFIAKQLSQKKPPTMYPPLYPIVLLLSRLLPFDMKQKSIMALLKQSTNKQIRKQQLLTLLPLLREAGDNHNYMGRVMTAKAILPFMYLGEIVPYCVEILKQHVKQLRNNTIVNNKQHYRLTECFQLLRSLDEIMNNSQNPNLRNRLENKVQQQVRQVLIQNYDILAWAGEKTSPTVHEIYIRIFHEIISNYFVKSGDEKLFAGVIQKCEELLLGKIKGVQIGDLGHSLMYKSAIQLLHLCYINTNSKQNIGKFFINYLQNQNVQSNETDFEMLAFVLQKIIELFNLNSQINSQLTKSVDEWLQKINIDKVDNDNTIIKVLSFLSLRKIKSSQQLPFIKSLQKIEQVSENKHLKVAIFDYLLSLTGSKNDLSSQISLECSQFLQSLLDSYSNPDRLEDLRECCILYLQQTQQLKSSLLLIYIRLLQDEEYQIRKRAAVEISRLLKIKPSNQVVVFREIIHRFLSGRSYLSKNQQYNQQKLSQSEQSQFLQKLETENTDYNITAKNHTEQRIFSYDKPNKYRASANTLYEISTIMDLEAVITGIPEQITENYLQNVQKVIEKYEGNIMQRDQFQFLTILRAILKLQNKGKSLKDAATLHPIFQKVSVLFSKK